MEKENSVKQDKTNMSKKNLRALKFKKNKNKGKGKMNSSGGLQLKGTNPISTYGSEHLINLAGNIPTAFPIGYPLKMDRDKVTTDKAWDLNNVMPLVIPGIYTYTYMPTFGVAKDPSSPINQAAAQIMKRIRAEGKISGTQYYDASDLMFYFMVCTSCFTAYRWLAKAYLIHLYWKDLNLYHAKEILYSMHIDPVDFEKNIPNILVYLNLFKYKLENLKLPKYLLIAERQMYMNEHIYKDVEGEKCQLFHFIPKHLYKYDATTPKLTPVDFAPAELMTWDVIKAKIDEIYNTVIPDEFFGIAASDIMKSLEDGDFWKAEELKWEDKIEPIYDEEMIFQAHNMDILNYSSVTGLDITQRTTSTVDTIIYWNPEFTVDSASCTCKRVVDCELEDPKPQDNMIMTRLKWLPNESAFTTFPSAKFTLKTCGSEIIVNAEIVTLDSGTMLPKRNQIFTFYDLTVGSISGGMVDGFVRRSANNYWFSLVAMSYLNYAPVCYMIEYQASSSSIWFRQFMHAVHNIYYLEDQVLENLNMAALYGELGLSKFKG